MVTADEVWEKGHQVSNNDPDKYRKDDCGAWIKYSMYGERDTEYGWEIDHIVPESKGGSNNISNLRPLHWKNNLEKGDGKLARYVTAQSEHNIGWE